MRHFTGMDRAMWIGAALSSLVGCSFPVDEFTAPSSSADGAIDSASGEAAVDSGSPSDVQPDNCERCGGTTCVDLTSINNCGTCGHKCAPATEKCSTASLTCVPKMP
jgi:hypothetical protein